MRAGLLSGVILLDARSRIATLTPEAREILGLGLPDRPEQPFASLPPPLLKLAAEVSASGKPSAFQQVLLTVSGRSQMVQVAAVPLKAEAGVVLTLHTLRTEGPFLQHIRQLDRLADVGTLTAGMAHEVKNALVAGRTFLDLLLEKNSDEELVQIVRRETGRIDSMVSRMLRFAASHPRSFRALHLHEVLEHTFRLIQPQLTHKSVVLERRLLASPDTTRGDEYELEQAFVNLLLNGLEAIEHEGKLTVSTETLAEPGHSERRLEIKISDSGSGILPEHLEHLFQPFFTTKSAGTGLGLVVTRRIIQEHGGSIAVQSQPQQGTTFSVILPLLLESSTAQSAGLPTAMLGRK